MALARIAREWFSRMVFGRRRCLPMVAGGPRSARVGAPVLVTPRRGEGHRFLIAPSGANRLLVSVEPAVYGQYPPAGSRAEVDADLCECGVDPELAEIGVLLQTSYCVDRLQIDLANALGTAALFVLETRFALLDEPLQGLVDGIPVDLEVAGDGLHDPAF